MNWELIWKVVFIGVVVVFAMMSVLVTVLGAKDIKRLLQHLSDTSNSDRKEKTEQTRRDDIAQTELGPD